MAALGLAAALLQQPRQVEADHVAPGIQPAVQKWMKGREASQIELNNALVPIVQKRIERPGAAVPACRRLARVVSALTRMAAAPNAEVNTMSRAGLAKFQQGAAACLAGDLPSTEQLVAQGLAERAAVQETLDETLDGD